MKIFAIAGLTLLGATGVALSQTPPAPATSGQPVTVITNGTVRGSNATTGTLIPVIPPGAFLEQSPEYRFQLDFHVNDVALTKLLPVGWVSAAATSGAAKDANVRLIFIDRQDITGPDNKVLGKGSDRLVYVAAPVKKTDGSATGQMILAGISEDDADAPGLSGKVVTATHTIVSRKDYFQSGTFIDGTPTGAVLATEDWYFGGADGSSVSMNVEYKRGPANRSVSTTNFYNPADSSHYFVFTTQQATDITRNVTTTPPDRVTKFSYKVEGAKDGGRVLAALFDGTEKPLSWDSQPTYNRIVSTGQ